MGRFISRIALPLVALGAAVVWSSTGCLGPVPEPIETPEPDPTGQPTTNEDPPATGIVQVRLPQSIAGAMSVNPSTYPVIDLFIDVEGDDPSAEPPTPASIVARVGAAELEVTGPEKLVLASDAVGFSTKTVNRYHLALDVAALGAGLFPLHVEAVVAEGATNAGETLVAESELAVAPSGTQLTDWFQVGSAATPRLHSLLGANETRLLLTWADRRDPDGVRRAWVSEIDGAGRMVGELMPLTPKDAEALYARCAISQGRVAVLAQEPGGPYENRLWVTNLEGAVELGPIDLDPDDRYGSWGGDIQPDGAGGFVLTWRTNLGDGGSGEVRWARITQNLDLIGPVVLAETTDDAWRGFDPHSFLSVATVGPRSTVAFVQKFWNTVLEMEIPRVRLVHVNNDDGVIVGDAETSSGWSAWQHEARVNRVGDGVVAHWVEADLLDEALPNPISFYGDDVLMGADMASGPPWVSHAGERFEADLSEHPVDRPGFEGASVLAWLDLRSQLEVGQGHISLYAANVELGTEGQRTVAEPHVFEHARFILGTSQVRATSMGPNVALTWLDERHGGSILDSKPEVWFETMWTP